MGVPFNVAALDRFTADLLDGAARGSTLAGFDFPIGLPAGYGRRTGLGEFRTALPGFGHGDWADFYDVAATSDQVGLRRPFYPRSPGGTSLDRLLNGHGVTGIEALTRRCETAGPGQGAAGCLFWTLGAKQVGKAMMEGWRGVVIPALERGARVWPFDGDLDALARNGLTLAETYPADVYERLGAKFRRNESKTRQPDRAAKAGALRAWAGRAGVALDPALRTALGDGFGAADRGGDRFDAIVGLFGMIDVVDGRRSPGAPDTDDVRRWEGWILGREGRVAGQVPADGVSEVDLPSAERKDGEVGRSEAAPPSCKP